MDFASTACVTAAIAALVMLATRNFGEKAAGLLAGLPLTTVPALVWISSERGAEIAAQVAIGSVIGCALTATFAAAYEQAARRFAPAVTLPLSLAALVAGFGLTSLGESNLFQAGVLAAAVSALALALMRRSASHRAASTAAKTPGRAVRGSTIAITALCAGAVGGGVVALASSMSPAFAGLFATLPIVGAATVTAEHATRGSASVTRFLRSYVVSGLAEAAFGAVFALCVIPGGIVNALALALVVSGVLCLVADRCVAESSGLRRSARKLLPV